MKIGFYNDDRLCLITDGGVVDIVDAIEISSDVPPQQSLESLITNFESLRPRLTELLASGKAIPISEVHLRPPVPRPGKVLCGQRNFKEGVPLDPPSPLSTFFKSPDAVVGTGDEIVLPEFNPTVFNHEAELGIIVGRKAKDIKTEDALNYVFGYLNAVDVSARQPVPGEPALPGPYGKCFDTFLPIGPYITTADEIPDPNALRVRYWVNDQLRQDYNTSDMEHGTGFFIATLSHCMTLLPGDLLLAGTNHSHLGPLQDGDVTEMEIDGLGRLTNRVKDPYKRSWEIQLREPQAMTDRRNALRGKPHGGTWPFQEPYTG